MLTEAAVTGNLLIEAINAFLKGYEFSDISVQEAIEEILRVLEHDGYLKPVPNGYIFVSCLLKDWWKKRYELFYVPVLNRGI